MIAEETLSRILYVEDDNDIRAIAGFALAQLGAFAVAACASGADALARATTFRPQLLLIDVMMPGMDGPATLERLRALALTATTPVVFMTAKVQPAEIARYHELGALGIISKPFDPMTLCETIRAIWRRRND
jgi:CheY-like chemotaxis protein